MANTPEGKIKKMTREFLEANGVMPASKAAIITAAHTGKYVMPVNTGRGVIGIPDFYLTYRGRFGEIETKKDATCEPTPLQKHQLNATSVTGGAAFVVGCEADLLHVKTWFSKIDKELDNGKR